MSYGFQNQITKFNETFTEPQQIFVYQNGSQPEYLQVSRTLQMVKDTYEVKYIRICCCKLLVVVKQ